MESADAFELAGDKAYGGFHPGAATAATASFRREQHAGGGNCAEPAVRPQAVPGAGLAVLLIPDGDGPGPEEQGTGGTGIRSTTSTGHLGSGIGAIGQR